LRRILVTLAADLAPFGRIVVRVFAELAPLRWVLIGRVLSPGSLGGIVDRVLTYCTALCDVFRRFVPDRLALHGIFVRIVHSWHAMSFLGDALIPNLVIRLDIASTIDDRALARSYRTSWDAEVVAGLRRTDRER
jgi:hypothetical protein